MHVVSRNNIIIIIKRTSIVSSIVRERVVYIGEGCEPESGIERPSPISLLHTVGIFYVWVYALTSLPSYRVRNSILSDCVHIKPPRVDSLTCVPTIKRKWIFCFFVYFIFHFTFVKCIWPILFHFNCVFFSTNFTATIAFIRVICHAINS